MTAPAQRSSGVVRIHTSARRFGAPVSCLLVAILTANQASARTNASLPYLVEGAPDALRFVPLHKILPPPKRPSAIQTDPPEPGKPAPAGEPSTPVVVDAGPHAAPTPAPAPVGAPPAGPLASPNSGAELVPDIYAPAPPVRIEDILPFFVAPPPPVSRATYELK
ncbi:MAG: hypothetical protein WC661_21970 [Opitutaceae bacterium]|jgi:hypothetical protein